MVYKMKILEKDITSNGTKIQIEEWNEDYSFMSYVSTIGAYPISQVNCSGTWSPKRGETFRLQLDFKSYDEAKEAYIELINGNKTLKDYKNEFSGHAEDWECI